MKRVFILLEGGKADLSHFKFNKEDIFICADGGYKRILNKNLKNKIVLVGDFDSIKKNDVIGKNIEIKEFPKDKDLTDGELAVKYSCEDFGINIPKIIIGGVTDRLDHTLGNLLILVPYVKRGHHFEIYGNRLKAYISSKNIKIKTKAKRIISIIPLEKIHNANIHGLKWKLKNENIPLYKSRTLRNGALKENVVITFDNGVMLVIETW